MKEAGRREWLVGHLCLFPAAGDVIAAAHVSAGGGGSDWLLCGDTGLIPMGIAFCVGCIQSSNAALHAAGGLFPLELVALRSPCCFRNRELSLGGRCFQRSKALKHASGVMTHGSFKCKTYSGHTLLKANAGVQVAQNTRLIGDQSLGKYL